MYKPIKGLKVIVMAGAWPTSLNKDQGLRERTRAFMNCGFATSMNQGTTIKLAGRMKYMPNTADELSAVSNVKYPLVNVG